MRCLELLRPDQYVTALERVDLDKLADMGIRGLLIDRDRTLTAWHSREVSEAKRRWLSLAAERFALCIVSNTIFGRGVQKVADELGIPAVCRWGLGRKPFSGAMREALRLLRIQPSEGAIIGDQLFTDILGGNLMGLHTVLVQPVAGPEFVGTRITRVFEAVVAARLCLAPGDSPRQEDNAE